MSDTKCTFCLGEGFGGGAIAPGVGVLDERCPHCHGSGKEPHATPRPDEDMRRVTASGDGQSKELCDWILGFLADECSLDQSCVSEADRSNIENAIENRISEVGAQLRQGSAAEAICSAAKATEADGPTRPSSASTDYAALMEGLPGPWTYHHGLPPGSKIAEWWVESATGRLLAGKIKNKSLARAIAAIPDMVAEIGRLRGIERREQFLTKRLAERGTELEGARSLIEKMREALQLFNKHWENNDYFCEHARDWEALEIPIGDLRKARAILTETEQK